MVKRERELFSKVGGKGLCSEMKRVKKLELKGEENLEFRGEGNWKVNRGKKLFREKEGGE